MGFSGLLACACLLAAPLRAEILITYSDLNSAVNNATNGKLILMSSGGLGCTDCVEFDAGTLYDPVVNKLMVEAFVFFNCDMDANCKDWKTYTRDLPSFPLPLVCVINPASPENYVNRLLGGGPPSSALPFLRRGLFASTAPAITNLHEGQPITSANFTVEGKSLFTNLYPRSAYWRLGTNGPWSSSLFTQGHWEAPLSGLVPGSSYSFSVYFTDTSLLHSATNTVTFGSGVTPTPPTVVVWPLSNNITDDPSATITATLDVGSPPGLVPPFTYQWQFCPTNQFTYANLVDSPLHVSGASSSSAAQTNSLTIIGATAALDMGYYRVVVTDNNANTVTSSVAVLTVSPCAKNFTVQTTTAADADDKSALAAMPRSPTAQPKDLPPALPEQTVPLGHNATFSVRTDNPPSLAYQWFRFRVGDTNWAPLFNNDHFGGADTNLLVITNATTGDAGTYAVAFGAKCTFPASDGAIPVAMLIVNTNGTVLQTITFDALSPKTYGDPPFGLTASADSGLPVSFTSLNTNVATISGTNLTIIGAGTSLIRASQAGDTNYSATNVSRSLTVSNALLIVTADDKSKIYGATNPPLMATIAGFVNGDTQVSAVTGIAAVTTTASPASGVGHYPITPARGTLIAPNYSFNFVTGSLTVTPGALTVIADNKSRPYGATNPPLTATIAGFVGGDSRTSAVTGSPDLSTTATPANVAATYPITVTQGSLAAANYTFSSFVPGILTVTTNDTLAPNLVITNYVDLQEVTTNRITLTGTASDAGLGDSGIKSVTVNGLPAANGSASGSATANWSMGVSLSPGTNTLRVVATDNAAAHNSTNIVIRIISDMVRPTCLITSPSLNQRCSNAVFTVKGTAKDNLQVTGVWCLTNGVWGYASPSNNNWANWSVDVALVPGLNTVKACAVDAAGNKSLTNTVTFNYVLSDRLTLASAGRGTLSPNYSNTMLEIGKTYTITAMPASGFAFTNWTGSLTTNAAMLRFVMQSNLLFTANFIDVQKPTCAITAPAPSQRWSNAVFTVKGTAKDNWQVAGVWCLTNGVWGYAAPSNNNWANWSVDVALVPGLNTVRACAVDAAGNKSVTNTVTFSYVLSDRLTLVTTGQGTLSPNYSNALLEIGKTYKITAMPGPGYVFSNWTGTVLEYPVISSSTAALSFVMRSNLVLEADFVPNPFIAFKGSYNGLFYPTINSQPHPSNATNTGFFALMVATNGGFSGRVVLQGTNFPISGAFNAQLQAQTQVARLGQPALALNLQLNPINQDGDTNVLTGTVGGGTDWLADLLAYRAVAAGSNGYGGAYTLLVGGCEDDGACFGVLTNVPWGDSPLIVRVNALTGSLQMSGTLADGNNLTQTTSVSENGFWPFYVPLYAGRGFLVGWLNFDQPKAILYWLMPASANRFYTNGFWQPRRVLLAKYIAPPVGQNAVTWTNADVVLVGGKLPGSLTNHVVLEHNALRVTGGSISNLNLTINPSSGLFSGFFVHPVTKQVTPFRGLVEQVLPPPESVNGGWFFGPDGSGGIIRIHPEPE